MDDDPAAADAGDDRGRVLEGKDARFTGEFAGERDDRGRRAAREHGREPEARGCAGDHLAGITVGAVDQQARRHRSTTLISIRLLDWAAAFHWPAVACSMAG